MVATVDVFEEGIKKVGHELNILSIEEINVKDNLGFFLLFVLFNPGA